MHPFLIFALGVVAGAIGAVFVGRILVSILADELQFMRVRMVTLQQEIDRLESELNARSSKPAMTP